MVPDSKWLRMPSVRLFDEVEPSKAQALKPLEEAAELFGAWQAWQENGPTMDCEEIRLAERIVDECCDTISAVCNLLAAFGVHDLAEPMRRCRERNALRGRITDGSRDAGA